MKFFYLAVAMANLTQGAPPVKNFESLISDPSCNRECVGYCLNYFPHHTILAKCGCLK